MFGAKVEEDTNNLVVVLLYHLNQDWFTLQLLINAVWVFQLQHEVLIVSEYLSQVLLWLDELEVDLLIR